MRGAQTPGIRRLLPFHALMGGMVLMLALGFIGRLLFVAAATVFGVAFHFCATFAFRLFRGCGSLGGEGGHGKSERERARENTDQHDIFLEQK